MKLTLVQVLLLTLLTVSYARTIKFVGMNEEYDFFADESSGPLPSIDFTAEWEENLHGELGVGRDFKINYDEKRLTAPVMVEYKFNDGPDFKSESLGNADANGVYHKTISIPIDADKVVMWFRHQRNENKSDYDSDYGKNYNFAINRPSVVFLNEWQEKQHGRLTAAGNFDMFYDSVRLNEGSQVEAQMEFLDHTVVGKTLDKMDGSTYQTAVISIPDNAEKVVMWFYYTDENGKKQYDSDYGKNYRFNLS